MFSVSNPAIASKIKELSTIKKGAAGGFVPNFSYQLKKYKNSDIRSIQHPETKSELNYAKGGKDKAYPYLDMVGIHSERSGQGLELFKRLGKIARRSGRKVRSSSLIPQTDRLKLLREDSNIDQILKLIYPQLSYRQKSGVKNTQLDFEFGEIEKTISGSNIFDLVKNQFKDVKSAKLINAIQNRDVGFSSVIDTFADGFIPNFVRKSREIGSGAFGTFFRLGKNKEGSDVGVKKFKSYIPSRSIEAEWLTSEFVNKYANIPSVFGPANLSTFEDSKRKRAIRKAVVSDPLARTAIGSEKASSFGQKVLFAAFKARGLEIGDFHGSNYTLNKSAQDAISGMQSFPSDPVGAFSVLRQIAATGGRIGAIDVGAAHVTDPARGVIGQIMARQASPQAFAKGFLPNFADPLKEAIGREMAAGVPSSQIYVDNSPSLKNSANPMGLMVANRRDEPAGGFQGINRARKEGANPMTYGAAGGFVPNYVEANVQPYIGQTRTQALDAENNDYRTARKELAKELREARKDLMYTKKGEVQQRLALEDRIKSLKENSSTLKAQSEANRKAIIQQTRGVLGTGRTATLRQATVASANPSQGGNRDLLGTIFAVQGAMSVLAGATEGSSNKIAIASNAIAEGIGSFSTASFAIQGLTQMAGNTGGAFGKVIGALGPYGMAVAGITAAYSATAKYLDEVNGVNKAAATNIAMMSDAASKAAFNLNNLPQAAQKNIKQSAVALVTGAATASTYTYAGGGFGNEPTKIERTGKVDFEGSDLFSKGELQKSLDSVSESALGAGVSYGVMWNAINEKSKDNKLTIKEVNQLTNEFTKLMMTSYELADAMRTLDLSPKSSLMKDLAGMSPEEFDKALTALKPGAPIDKKTPIGQIQQAMVDALPDNKKAAFDPNSEAFKNQARIVRGQAADQNKAQKDEAVEREKTFRTNLGKIEAEIKLNQKLDAQKKDIFIAEQAQKEALANIENDISLSENDRLKAVAAINMTYGQSIALLTEQEQKTKNIGDALISGLTGVPGIFGDQIAGFAENISKDLPEFNIENITEYKTALEGVFKNAKLPQDAFTPLTEGLVQAEIANKVISDEKEKQISISEKEYGIQIKSINASSDKLSLEKQISAQIEARNSEASFKIENRVLNNAYETLSINKEIEQIKRETSLNELQKAEQVYKLELKRRNLESTGIGIGLDQKILDIDQELIDKARAAIESSLTIPKAPLGAGLTIQQLEERAAIDPIALERINYEKANAERQRELARKGAANQQAGLGDVVPDVAIDKAKTGFLGGMESGVKNLQNQINTFAFDIGEKIPQMFSDNMSSAINKMIEGGESFSSVLRGAAYEFVKGINQANIKNLSDQFSNSLFKSDGGVASGIASIFKFASGGKVNGGSGSKDDVPAMLMGGEYVVNKKAVSKYGAQFLESVNNGTLTGYAKGGSVQRGPQGNFYTPGTFGQGAIEGKRNLLDFATQTGTTGQFDKIVNQSGYQAIDLEPESSRLSVSGMRNSPQFEATQAAKEQAFDLYLQQYNAELEAKKAEKEQKKAFRKQLMMLAISAVAGPVLGAAGAGFGAAFKGAAGQGLMSQLGAGAKGIFTGGSIGGQQVGGLGNLFSSVGKAFTGDFAGAGNQFKLSQIGNSGQLADLYKSDKSFASYIDSMGGFDTSGALKAIPAGFGGTIPSGIARSGRGVIQSGNVNRLADRANATAIQKSMGIEPDLPIGYETLNVDNILLGDKPKKNATGGMIPSTSGIDTVPAMLSGGEFVMNRSAVQGIGSQNLQSMNSGGTSIASEETSKKLNEQLLAKLDELISASGSTGDITINVAPSGQSSQENSQDPSAGRQQLARQIKDAVLQIINDEKRIGGSLRR
jgi:hypothetical protein